MITIHQIFNLSEGCGYDELAETLKLGQDNPEARIEIWDNSTVIYSSDGKITPEQLSEACNDYLIDEMGDLGEP